LPGEQPAEKARMSVAASIADNRDKARPNPLFTIAEKLHFSNRDDEQSLEKLVIAICQRQIVRSVRSGRVVNCRVHYAVIRLNASRFAATFRPHRGIPASFLVDGELGS
jgi:hypothetical protein